MRIRRKRRSANAIFTDRNNMSLAVIFDIDGTLVDTNYQHALAWYRAFRQHDVIVPVWRIHRAIGIGSDRVVEMLAGDHVEQTLGESLRAAEGPLYQEMVDEVEPMAGAHQLLRDLKRGGHSIILASSAEEKDAERYIRLLGARISSTVTPPQPMSRTPSPSPTSSTRPSQRPAEGKP
jgi:beta-phosphoglucomutase-like phosphatase (HAD superfamily)